MSVDLIDSRTKETFLNLKIHFICTNISKNVPLIHLEFAILLQYTFAGLFCNHQLHIKANILELSAVEDSDKSSQQSINLHVCILRNKITIKHFYY